MGSVNLVISKHRERKGKKMVTIKQENFSIEQICNSGQCFRMKEIGGGVYEVIAFGKYLEVTQKGDEITFSCTKEEFESIWRSYFDLDTCYGTWIESIDENDEYLRKASQFGNGIRILRQDVWEMIISFIISQQNNIKRIRKCIETICEKYGEQKVNDKGEIYYDFPTVEVLARVSEEELRNCNLGYRSKYIVKTSHAILNGEVDLERLKHMEFQDAKEELLKLTGIGVKVADCICLFGLHHLDGFPVDTHIKQVFEKQYAHGFPFEKYKGYAGVLQQYIFYYDLLGDTK